MSLTKTLQRKVTLYDKGIIQRKDTNWKTLSIFFCLFWNFFRTNRRYPVFAGAFHTGSGICTFHPFPVPAFSLRYYRKIAQCVLFCLYLCKNGLLAVHECNRPDYFAPGSGRPQNTTRFSLYRWYYGPKVRYKICRCFKTLWPCCTCHKTAGWPTGISFVKL